MRNSILLFFVFLACSCVQNTNVKSFVGRIYILESQGSFFQFTSKDSIDFYSIDEFDGGELTKNRANWKMINDTTMMMTVIYEPEMVNSEFIFIYRKEKDYWIDIDLISAYRRKESIRYKDVNIVEF